MKTKTQKYTEAVERNIRNMNRLKYQGMECGLACHKLGIRKHDTTAQYEVRLELSRSQPRV